MERIRLPVKSRLVLGTILLVVIVAELAMMVPTGSLAVSTTSWVTKQLRAIDRDPGLSRESHKKIQALLERSRADLEQEPWNRLTMVVAVTFVVTTVFNALIWFHVLRPLSQNKAQDPPQTRTPASERQVTLRFQKY